MFLSWDLFIMVFFSIVVAYSFIIGRKDIMKIIIATYIATLCADGVGNLVSTIIQGSNFLPRLFSLVGVAADPLQTFAFVKIILLITIVVILTIAGDYEVEEPPAGYHPFIKLLSVTFLAILSGGLILSSILVFANGGSLIDGTNQINQGLLAVYKQSRFVRLLLDWHDIWFSLPGIVFCLISILQRNKQ